MRSNRKYRYRSNKGRKNKNTRRKSCRYRSNKRRKNKNTKRKSCREHTGGGSFLKKVVKGKLGKVVGAATKQPTGKLGKVVGAATKQPTGKNARRGINNWEKAKRIRAVPKQPTGKNATRKNRAKAKGNPGKLKLLTSANQIKAQANAKAEEIKSQAIAKANEGSLIQPRAKTGETASPQGRQSKTTIGPLLQKASDTNNRLSERMLSIGRSRPVQLQGQLSENTIVTSQQGQKGQQSENTTVTSQQGQQGQESENTTVTSPQGQQGQESENTTVTSPQGQLSENTTITSPQRQKPTQKKFDPCKGVEDCKESINELERNQRYIILIEGVSKISIKDDNDKIQEGLFMGEPFFPTRDIEIADEKGKMTKHDIKDEKTIKKFEDPSGKGFYLVYGPSVNNDHITLKNNFGYDSGKKETEKTVMNKQSGEKNKQSVEKNKQSGDLAEIMRLWMRIKEKKN